MINKSEVSIQHQHLPDRTREAPIVIRERTRQNLEFNVMPDRPVREALCCCEYRVWDRYVEGEFDREYHSTMLNSPDHLIFLSMLIQCQKLIYVYMCHALRLPYEPSGPELVKIWPTRANVTMQAMVTKGHVTQCMSVVMLRRISENTYFGQIEATVEHIRIQADTMIYVLTGQLDGEGGTP
jgi:hypothetical protein